jgi:hypothetical protein
LTTPIVDRLYGRIRAQLGGYGVRPFLEQKSLDAGDDWEVAIDEFIARATLFVAFISIDFWLSVQCRRELDLAIARYEKERLPRLLFVLADRLDPTDLAFDEDEAADRLGDTGKDAATRRELLEVSERIGKVKRIGQINFLGPYDPHSGALVRLAFEDPGKADDQLAALIESIKKLPELA